MKNIIYYFSGTGNSLASAKQMAAKLGNFEIIPITKALNTPLDKDLDYIGLSFPVYAHRPPHIVARFLKKLRKEGVGNYIFAMANSAGGPGRIVKITAKALGRGRLNLGFNLTMPNNYLPFMKEDESSELKSLKLEGADKKISEMAERIKKRENYLEPHPDFFKSYIIPELLYKAVYPGLPRFDKQFHVSEGCTGCGRCEKVCPVDNLKMEAKRPTWQQRCEQCFACLHWCPKGVIQWGKNTAALTRYRHPDLTLNEAGQ